MQLKRILPLAVATVGMICGIATIIWLYRYYASTIPEQQTRVEEIIAANQPEFKGLYIEPDVAQVKICGSLPSKRAWRRLQLELFIYGVRNPACRVGIPIESSENDP